MGKELLAILGRGIQMTGPDLNPTSTASWDLTEDLEVCDTNSAHLPVRVPADDENPYCMVGGGQLNLSAGLALIAQYKPRVVVCAYGHRSDYLVSINAPSESEVMSKKLKTALYFAYPSDNHKLGLPNPEIVVWDRERMLTGASNTGRELRNIFDLAIERRLKKVVIVTVGVHVARTATYVAKLLSVHEHYRALSPQVLESEEVLLRLSEEHRPRVESMRASKSFARNWAREADGMQKIIRDVYGDNKPKVVTT